jgi:hypothetical protein
MMYEYMEGVKYGLTFSSRSTHICALKGALRGTDRAAAGI